MPRPSTAPRAVLGVAAAALFVAGAYFVVTKLRFRPQPSPPVQESASSSIGESGGFREAATASGITFRMQFLPAEQGEKFKINLYDHGCGVAVGDYDGDGHDDVYFTNQLGPNALYRNQGNGNFTEVTESAGVALGDRISVAATFADYDNDGRQDLFVTSTRGGNVLYQNRGNGKFENVTAEAGVTSIAHSQSAGFFDYDNDGYLDLLVTNTAKWTLDTYDAEVRYYPGLSNLWQLAASPREKHLLYHNNQNGTFTEVTANAGLEGDGWGGDLCVLDFDDDGRLDVFITNMFGASQLYRNAGDGKFTPVTKQVLGRTSWGAIGCKAFDCDNDGRLDVFVADMHSDMWLPWSVDTKSAQGAGHDYSRKYPKVQGPYAATGEIEARFASTFNIRYDDVIFGNALFHKLPAGGFEEISTEAHAETFWPWGVATGDFDNDGYEDVFLPSGMGYPWGYWPSALLVNNGNRTFADRAATAGIDPPPGGTLRDESIGGKPAARSARCAAAADFDGDGRLDLVVNNFNDRAHYFRNQFPRRSYVAFRLTGTKSNRDAVGALVTLRLGNEVMVRQVHAAGGYLSQASQTLHFGLGERARIDSAEVRWPSGARQRIDAPAINTLHRLVEPGP